MGAVDYNFKSFANLIAEDQSKDDWTVLNPIAEHIIDWTDTLKFSKVRHCRFNKFHVVLGGEEDAVDINNKSIGNVFEDFKVNGDGRYCLTLKGGSSGNVFKNWLIEEHANAVDIEIGNWSDQSTEDNKDNVFYNVQSYDGKPVTYCYRWGSKPVFHVSNVKHLWWRSAAITLYWWGKYLLVKKLKKS